MDTASFLTLDAARAVMGMHKMICLFEDADGFCERAMVLVETNRDGQFVETESQLLLTAQGTESVRGWGADIDGDVTRVAREGVGHYLVPVDEWSRVTG